MQRRDTRALSPRQDLHTPSAEKRAEIQLLGRMTGANGAAIVEPVDRPEGEMMTGLRGAAAAEDRPLFLIGYRQDYTCLTSRRTTVVYDKADVETIKQLILPRLQRHTRFWLLQDSSGRLQT